MRHRFKTLLQIVRQVDRSLLHAIYCTIYVAIANGFQNSASLCSESLNSGGFGAGDGQAVHDSAGRVVGDGVVLHAAVVPHGQRAGAPTVAALERGRPDVLEQHREQRFALGAGEAVDPGCEVAVDEQRPAAGVGVDSHDGVMQRHGSASLGGGRAARRAPKP